MPYYFGYFMDYYYVVLIIPVMIASFIIQSKMKSTYRKYALITNHRGITGAQAAQIVLNYYGIYDVAIREIPGNLTDNFDPRTKVISLSSGVYGGSSIASVGVACHEAGHAAQHAAEYSPIKVRNAFVPVCQLCSNASVPLIVIGVFLSLRPLVWVGIGFFAFMTLFHFLTLPVEFNASKRAIEVIESNGLLTYEEKTGAAKVLRAAALTYVASFAMSLAQLLRLVLRFGGRRRK